MTRRCTRPTPARTRVAAISLSKRPAAKMLRKHRIYLPPSSRRSRRTTSAPALVEAPHDHVSPAARRAPASLSAARTPKSCTGPTLTQEQAYVSAVLKALNGPRPRRAEALRSAAARAARRPAAARSAPFRISRRTGSSAGCRPLPIRTTSRRHRRASSLWISGKGFGSGPNPTYYFGGAKTPFQTPQNTYGTYVLDLLIGRVGSLADPDRPSSRRRHRRRERAAAPDQPGAATRRQPDSQRARAPEPADQARLLHRAREPHLRPDLRQRSARRRQRASSSCSPTTASPARPAASRRMLTRSSRQFPLLDHFYADSEVSVDGHIITSSAYAIDYAQKATAANYSNRRGYLRLRDLPRVVPAEVLHLRSGRQAEPVVP